MTSSNLITDLLLSNPLVTQPNPPTFRPNLLPNPLVTQPTGGLGIKARF